MKIQKISIQFYEKANNKYVLTNDCMSCVMTDHIMPFNTERQHIAFSASGAALYSRR